MQRQKRLARGNGVILPIFSIPSNYGIGTFGKKAYQAVDFISDAAIKYWQILPLGQTSYGDSPYQSFSSFAGNPYFIDLDMLIEEGLLEKEELENLNFGDNERYVDYGINTTFATESWRRLMKEPRSKEAQRLRHLGKKKAIGLRTTPFLWQSKRNLM